MARLQQARGPRHDSVKKRGPGVEQGLANRLTCEQERGSVLPGGAAGLPKLQTAVATYCCCLSPCSPSAQQVHMLGRLFLRTSSCLMALSSRCEHLWLPKLCALLGCSWQGSAVPRVLSRSPHTCVRLLRRSEAAAAPACQHSSALVSDISCCEQQDHTLQQSRAGLHASLAAQQSLACS